MREVYGFGRLFYGYQVSARSSKPVEVVWQQRRIVELQILVSESNSFSRLLNA